MKRQQVNWTINELKIYLILFLNNTVCNSQIDIMVLNNFDLSLQNFNEIKREFDHDNDYQSIQKINALIENGFYSKSQINNLFYEVKTICFEPRRKLHFLMNNMFTNLERIINAA